MFLIRMIRRLTFLWLDGPIQLEGTRICVFIAEKPGHTDLDHSTVRIENESILFLAKNQAFYFHLSPKYLRNEWLNKPSD